VEQSKSLMKLSKVLKAFADPTRLEIIALLSFRPHCVCELASIIGLSQPTISRHLMVLTVAGITTFEKSKYFIIYKLSPKDPFINKLLEILIEEMRINGLYDAIISKTTPIPQVLQKTSKTLYFQEGENAK